jgi:hypothetical protein
MLKKICGTDEMRIGSLNYVRIFFCSQGPTPLHMFVNIRSTETMYLRRGFMVLKKTCTLKANSLQPVSTVFANLAVSRVLIVVYVVLSVLYVGQ